MIFVISKKHINNNIYIVIEHIPGQLSLSLSHTHTSTQDIPMKWTFAQENISLILKICRWLVAVVANCTTERIHYWFAGEPRLLRRLNREWEDPTDDWLHGTDSLCVTALSHCHFLSLQHDAYGISVISDTTFQFL